MFYDESLSGPAESMVSSEEEDLCNVQASESEDEGPFGFKRNKSCQYNMVSFRCNAMSLSGGTSPNILHYLISIVENIRGPH